MKWLKLLFSRKHYTYQAILRYTYTYHDSQWMLTVPQLARVDLTTDQMVELSIRELRMVRPRRNEADYGFVWPGGSNKKYMMEFVFTTAQLADGEYGWSVSYTHPNENSEITSGPKFRYGREGESAIREFLHEQIFIAEMEMCSKILSRE